MGREIEAKSCVRDFLIPFAVFVRYKFTIDENVSFTDYVSGIRLPDSLKLPINWEKGSNNNFLPSRHRQLFLTWFWFFLCFVFVIPSIS